MNDLYKRSAALNCSENHNQVIESRVRFSQSRLWQAQRSYYDQQGIDAWVDEVPFYVTSNPVIADKYASVTARFLQDWVERDPQTVHNTFYIVELGAGTGQFSFYFLKRFINLLQRYRADGIKFCYVMTDFTSNNIDYWKEHPGLRGFIDKGLLDFAVFDIEQDQSIELILQQKTLSSQSLSTPITLIANYLFDSIVVDVFKIQNQTIQASYVSAAVSENHKNGDEIQWDKVNFSYDNLPIEEQYYQQSDINSVLMSYQNQLEKSYLHFPIGALQGLENISAISQGKLMLLSSDKGYVSLPELEDLNPPEIAFHGSFSLMVNYHAIGEYCKRKQGGAFTQKPFDSFSTSAFSIGFEFQGLPRTYSVLEDSIGEFCPGHYYHFYDHFEQTINSASLEYIASVLNFTHWDPEIFNLAHERISDLIDGADADVVDYLALHLPAVIEHFYFMPGVDDVIFAVATFFQEIGEYQTAVHYYKQSIKYFEPGFEVWSNLGDCYFELEKNSLAIESLEKALVFKPNDQGVKHMISDAQRQINHGV